MGLYLCIFDGDDELGAVEVGSYSDWGSFTDHVTATLEGGSAGARFPTLILHSDCDGEWTPTECSTLLSELQTVQRELQSQPPIPFAAEWQSQAASRIGLQPASAAESFVNVDGELLLHQLRRLAALAVERNLPILFQ